MTEVFYSGPNDFLSIRGNVITLPVVTGDISRQKKEHVETVYVSSMS